MRVIGLTGNIGCGKTTVARMLAERGVATIDADVVARELRETDAVVRGAIERRFGTSEPGALARLAFPDPAALADLEAILHPAVRGVVARRLEELEADGTAAACVEAIKLLESPLRERCDAIWVVTCDERDAFRRLADDRGMGAAEARRRLARQSAQADKVAAADVVIDGSAPLRETERQVEGALRLLLG